MELIRIRRIALSDSDLNSALIYFSLDLSDLVQDGSEFGEFLRGFVVSEVALRVQQNFLLFSIGVFTEIVGSLKMCS